MRALMIAAGFCIAASGASASTETTIASKTSFLLTLVNGCTYTPVVQSTDNTWNLRAAPSLSVFCPNRVRTRAPKLALVPDYIVGVYR